MFKPDQFAANHNPKAEHLWSVKINWGIRDRMENTVGHAAYCLWVKTAPAPRSGIWVTVEQRTPHLCSCFHPAVSPGLLTLKPNMRAHRLLGKVESQFRTALCSKAQPQARAAAGRQTGQAYSSGAASTCGWPLCKASFFPCCVLALDSIVIGTYPKPAAN